MPTTVTKTIAATSSPTVPDYTSLAAWFAGCPANLVTSDEIWDGQCLNQGEFVSASTLLNITGITTDATRYIILECASGASFRDNASVRTNALLYNASNGVAVRCTGNYSDVIQNAVDYTRLLNMQVKTDSTNGSGRYCWDDTSATVTHDLIDSCIFQSGSGGTVMLAGEMKNSLVVNTRATGTGVDIGSNTAMQLYENTIVNSTGSSGDAIHSVNSTHVLTIKNNAFFGFGAVTDSGDTTPFSFNATDKASAPGSNNQTSLTFASQFVSSSNDFRAVSSGSLKNGTPDSTNTPTDITGTTRDATTPYIGCWEVVAAAAGGPFPHYTRRRMEGGMISMAGGVN